MVSLKQWAMVAAVVVAGARGLRADTIWVGDTMRDAIKVENVKIQEPKGDKLAYLTAEGMSTSKVFTKLQQISVDGETSFNSAEEAYSKRDYDTAITGYQSVLQSSSKDWIQSRAAMRLIAAAKVKNRYDAEVAAYVALVQKDPASAAANHPGEPAENSQYLDAALASISKVLGNANLDASQKSNLLTLQLHINQLKGNNTEVQATLKQLVALGGGNNAMKATLKLADASIALDGKQYPQAISDIEENRALFTDPDQQVDALFILAQAKFATDGEKTDPDTLKDLALNYMRVVTFGNLQSDKPHVAESLFQTAVIEEKLKENPTAVQLYTQISTDRAFTNSPYKAKADAAIARLKGAK